MRDSLRWKHALCLAIAIAVGATTLGTTTVAKAQYGGGHGNKCLKSTSYKLCFASYYFAMSLEKYGCRDYQLKRDAWRLYYSCRNLWYATCGKGNVCQSYYQCRRACRAVSECVKRSKCKWVRYAYRTCDKLCKQLRECRPHCDKKVS